MAAMPRRTLDPATLNLLTGLTSKDTVEQASRIFLADGVILTGRDADEDGELFRLMTTSGSSSAQFYEVNLFRYSTGELGSSCTCGQPRCVHEIASIMHLISEDELVMTTDPGQVERREPGWRDRLESVLTDRTPRPPDPAQEICLFFSYEDGSVRIRPGERGSTGKWVKGRIRWDRLIYRDLPSTVKDTLLWISELHRHRMGFGAYGQPQDWLPLDELPARHLWDLLLDLRDGGVEMVTWTGRNSVALDDTPARVRMTARLEDEESALVLSADLRYGESAAPNLAGMNHFFLGDPATVVAEVRETSASNQEITLRHLDEPATTETLGLINQVRSLRIERDGIDDFERNYLPRIRDLLPIESPDESYAPPEPRPPLLTLEVSPVVDEDDSLVRVRLHWEWDYSSGVHDSGHETAVEAAVWDAGVSVDDWSLPRNEAIPFLAETLPRLDGMEHVEVTVTKEVPDFRPAQDAPIVTVGSTGDGSNDWFDLNVTVRVGGEEVNFAELFTALSRDEEIFVLPSGTYFPLDTPELDQLRRIIEEAKTLNDVTVDGLRISRYQVDLWAELLESGIVDAQTNAWWGRVNALVDDDGFDSAGLTVPQGVDATLRDYQVQGFRWLETLRRNNLGGILADDMGLGKTLQVIAMMVAAGDEARAEGEKAPPFLVVAPTSVVGNWVKEVEKFAPGLSAVAVDATEKKRGLPLTDVVATAGENGADVVVTSYTLFRLDFEAYNDIDWSAAIFDEAQMIKNHASRAYACARKLAVPVKIAVTGTPLENNLLELWALASLSCPGLLGSRKHFTDFFRTPVEKDGDSDRLDLLQRRIRPFLLRRTKDLVADEIPAKTENVTELELAPKHRRIYDRRLQRERQKVLGLIQDMNSNRFEVFRSLTLLRQLALDSELAGEETSPSAKLEALSELLTSVTAEGHKVLVLSQFTRFLRKARDVATNAGIDSAYLDGTTRNRQTVIDEFREGDAGVFFISLKAGGFGLNLTEADYVVLLDPWWNPATEAQAVDRAHRIGQTRSVMVYRLVSANTIESKVMDLKKSKAALFDRVLDGGGSVEADGLSAADIRALME